MLFPFVEARAPEPILPLALFRNRTFVVTSAVGFIVGLALFGSVTYLPLYQQIVKGHSPTASGLQLTPLMGGLLVTSIVSGNLISQVRPLQAVPDRRHRADDGRASSCSRAWASARRRWVDRRRHGRSSGSGSGW